MPRTGEIVDVMIPLILRREPEAGEIAVPAAGRIREGLAVHADDDAVRVTEQHANLALGADPLFRARASEAIEKALPARGGDLGPRVRDEAKLDLEAGARVGRGLR